VLERRAVILVEGESDALALRTLAVRRGRDLDVEGVSVVAIGGITNLATYLGRYRGDRVSGLYDAAEEHLVVRAFETARGLSGLAREDIEGLGFFMCDRDLEDELIRALGPRAVETVIDTLGGLGAFRTFQKQPYWRGRAADEQLRRFIAAHSGWKAAAARALIHALDLDRVPAPLDRVLSRT
jgi:hypothetical protein